MDVCIEGDANENLCYRFEDVEVRDNSNGQSYGELYFFGATLQLRGVSHIIQPLVDSSGNILVFNGDYQILFGMLIIYHRICHVNCSLMFYIILLLCYGLQ